MKKVLYIFSHLEDVDVDWMANKGRAERVAAGQTLIQEGDILDSIFLLLEGSLQVSARGAGALSTLEWGEIIGEMSLVDGRAASASVEAIETSQVLRISRAELERHVQTNAGFSARFYRGISVTLSERLRMTNARLSAGPEPDEELSEGLLDSVHLAGARFDRLLKRVAGHG